MSFDILSVLRNNNIEFIDSGPNVQTGNVNIKCPYCSNDPSYHMGINLTTGKYGCWRSDRHRGNKIERLISRLIKCSIMESRRQLGLDVMLDDNESLTNVVNRLDTIEEHEEYKKETKIGGATCLTLPKHFRKLVTDDVYLYEYCQYLNRRGFKRNDIDSLSERFNLHVDTYGLWKYRIIFPIYMNNMLVTWQSRSIHPYETLHYKDLSVNESVVHCKFTLFDYDMISRGGNTLFITEGVFDAVKLSWYLPATNIATCLFTKTMTDEQFNHLTDIGNRFRHVKVLLDNDALPQSIAIKERLQTRLDNVSIAFIPETFKDPGELKGDYIRRMTDERAYTQDSDTEYRKDMEGIVRKRQM